MAWFNNVYDEELPVYKKQCKQCGKIGWLMYRAVFSDDVTISPICWECLTKRADSLDHCDNFKQLDLFEDNL